MVITLGPQASATGAAIKRPRWRQPPGWCVSGERLRLRITRRRLGVALGRFHFEVVVDLILEPGDRVLTDRVADRSCRLVRGFDSIPFVPGAERDDILCSKIESAPATTQFRCGSMIMKSPKLSIEPARQRDLRAFGQHAWRLVGPGAHFCILPFAFLSFGFKKCAPATSFWAPLR